MAFKVLIESQQAAVSAAEATQFTVVAGDEKAITVSATALVSAETAIVTYSPDSSIAFAPAFSEGVALVLSATQPQVVVIGAGNYRVSKGVTVSACAIHLVGAVL